MNDTIPSLSIELTTDGLIELSQQNGLDEPDRIEVHPLHLRHMAEKLGLIHEATASEPELLRDLDRMKRNMLRVREHALSLQHKFATEADWEHADLSFEMGLINVLVGLLDMAVDDFADDFSRHDPEPHAPTAKPSTNPEKTQWVSGGDAPSNAGALSGQLEIASL